MSEHAASVSSESVPVSLAKPVAASSTAAATTTAIGPALAAEALVVGYGHREVLHGIDVAVEPGTITTIIGPNGCGKSTLLKAFGRLLTPQSGQVLLAGTPIRAMRTREVARRLALLPQNPVAPEGISAADLAARGRQPHQPWYRQWSREDDQVVANALADAGMADLSDLPLDELSGGQRQRAWIAMTPAQEAAILLLDEPTTHLDLAHAVEVLDLVVNLRRRDGRAVVLVLHDLGLAACYSDRLIVMKDGRLVTQGPPADVLSAELLEDVFGVRTRIFPDPVDGRPTIVPTGHA